MRRATARRRRMVAGIAALVLVGTVAYGASRLGGSAGDDPIGPTAAGPAAPASELLVLQVEGTADPLLAVIGARRGDRAAAFFSVPFDLMLTVPGQGEATATEVAGLDPTTIRVALSNTFGAWASHVARFDLDGLARVVDRAGGLRVRVPGFYVTDAGNLGPGAKELTGAQVAALLQVQEDGAEARWSSVVQALLRQPVRLGEEDLAESDGLAGVRRVLRGARGAAIAAFPTTTVAGTVMVPLQPNLDRAVAEAFGVRTPVPVIVENGVGTPGLGEDVAALLLPLGFRVVLSQNADLFGHERTRVVANSDAAIRDARRVRNALGVGRVRLSQVPSGIGDITIVVGEDFTG
ncbi:MAG TPA: LytR C-terminal domain-containing protein [Actinomycetota bacterium]|nr:LytR C-terminal domain-containing protein [Actinomycetota bacterium]